MGVVTTAVKPSTIYQWPPQGRWRYEDYARLPEDGRRYEVIGGTLYMSPAPRTNHQLVSFELAFALYSHVKAKQLGKVLAAPVDLILPEMATPVQPDILFIASQRLDMIREKYIEGVPDLIIEVLSPGNPQHDRLTKYDLYARAGVQEYWIVEPDQCVVDVYSLHGENLYVPFGHFERGGVIHSSLLPALQIPLDEIC